MATYSTCRFCKEWCGENGVKYGTRHYAHFHCYLAADKKLEDLHAWQVSQFPYRLLKEAGLLDKARELAGSENPISGELLDRTAMDNQEDAERYADQINTLDPLNRA